jgi:ATP-dependent DNA helicase RecG
VPQTPALDFSTPLQYTKGIGPARAKSLEAKGLLTVEDLLFYMPFRYEDRSNLKPIRELAPGEMATVIGRVLGIHSKSLRRGTKLVEVSFADGSGGSLTAKWFHGGWIADAFRPGMLVALYGKVEVESYSRSLAMVHPDHEAIDEDPASADAALHTGRIVPVYTAIGKVSTRMLRKYVLSVMEQLPAMRDALPKSVREPLKFPPFWEALRESHFPATGADLRALNHFRSPAQYRLIFEEFFWLECGLMLKRRRARKEPGISFGLNDRVREQIKKMLPFKPTGAQKRVLGEIAADMKEPSPMLRRQSSRWRTATRWPCWRPRKSWPRSITCTSGSSSSRWATRCCC